MANNRGKQKIRRAINKYRVYLLKRKGIQMNYSVKVDKNVEMNLISPFFGVDGGSITIGNNSFLSNGVICDAYSGSVTIGDRVFLGPYTVLYGHGNITIGNDCLIAMGCKIISANHTVPSRSELIRLQPDSKKEIIIGNDVWLGADVKVLAGVTIGDGCIVGAGSVVTRSLPPFSYSVGVPAKVVKFRV